MLIASSTCQLEGKNSQHGMAMMIREDTDMRHVCGSVQNVTARLCEAKTRQQTARV